MERVDVQMQQLLNKSLGLFNLNFNYKNMVGNYEHKLILRDECEDWLSHRMEHYPTRQSRLQLFHTPRAISSHSKQSIAIAGPEKEENRTTGSNITTRSLQ